MTASHSRRRRGGFTLIEVLLVLVILVILASLAVTAYGPIQRKAKIKAATSQINLFKSALGLYQLDIGEYPTSSQGLAALRAAPADLVKPEKWDGVYLETDVPLDQWDNPFQYESPGTHNPDSYDLWSAGPDGTDGTEDDITNWSLE